MNTIKGMIEDLQHSHLKADKGYSICTTETEIIIALDKQIPKKPTNTSWTHYHCPVCRKSVNSKYCGNCGQAIDWSDADAD